MTITRTNCLTRQPSDNVETGHQPPWFAPCGCRPTSQENTKPTGYKITWQKQLEVSLRRIRLQLRITMRHYKVQNYNKRYEEVRSGVMDHQFAPNWIPGKGDVNILLSLSIDQRAQLALQLPKLHNDFQKFSIALEAILNNEPGEMNRQILLATQSKSRLFLCEVESALIALEIGVPARIHRQIMTSAERLPADNLQRRIRDWSILMKYGDYLKGWSRIFKKVIMRNKTTD